MSSTDYAKLVLRVDSLEARTATRDVDKLARSGNLAEQATGSLTAMMGGLASALISTAGAAALLGKAIAVQRQFDVINAGLITATGSADGAAVAFEALADFAATTPYDLAQVSDSFIKLVNLGLDPSERALRSYGNTASAMGKDLNMLVEAVADAATGEFERLKEFGIKAKSEGDQVKLTFRGVTTEIGKNAAEIEDYLIKIGETQFADAMSNRMDTLDGKLSNLSDEWDAVFRNIMGSNIGDGIEGMVEGAISTLQDLNDYLASGEFESHMDAMAATFGPFVEDAEEAFDLIVRFVRDMNNDVANENPELQEALERVWRDFPANVRALVQLATNYFAKSVEDLKIQARGLADSFNAIFSSDTLEAAAERTRAAVERNQQVYRDAQDYALSERDATIQATKAAEQHAVMLRNTYEFGKKLKEQAKGGDRLSQFGIDRTTPAGATDGAAKKASDAAAKKQKADLERLRGSLQTEEEEIATSYAEREVIINAALQRGSDEQIKLSERSLAMRDKELRELADSRNKDFDNLKSSLRSEEESIQASYDKRIAIINDNVTVGEEARARLREKVEADRQADLTALAQAEQAKMDQLWQGLQTEEEEMVAFHERRKQIILDATLKTEKERQELLRREEVRFMEEQMARESRKAQEYMSATSGFFGAMSQLMVSFGKSSDKDAKKRWKMSQNFAMAQAVVSTAAGIAKALEKGFPLSLIEGAAAAATGAAQIAAIKSQTYSGSYDLGGQIPAGKWGWVGEAGPEKVRGPATVTGRKASERLGGGGGNISSNVNVYMNGDGTARTETSASGTGDDAQNARELGNLVSAKVREVLDQESRAGGRLWRIQNG